MGGGGRGKVPSSRQGGTYIFMFVEGYEAKVGSSVHLLK